MNLSLGKGQHQTMPSLPVVFAGKRLLLTGATGFVGMYTAAKLLTDIPELGGLVLPVRTRRDRDPAARWREVVATNAEVFKGADLSKVVLIGLSDLATLPDALMEASAIVGQIHAVINVAADVSWELDEVSSRRANCDSVLALYKMCRQAPKGHPLSTVDGFVQTSTFTVTEGDFSGDTPVFVTRQRLLESAELGSEEEQWQYNKTEYGKAKRQAEALLGKASATPVNLGGRKVPLSVVRPGCTGGCSPLSGALASHGWVNQGNLHVPMSYFLYSGQPDGETPPKAPFLPRGLDESSIHFAPVDIVANIHLAALALTLSHPDRLDFGGAHTPVFNACHDQHATPITFWTMLSWLPHFDERNFEILGPRVWRLLEELAEGSGSSTEKIRKVMRPLGLLYGPPQEIITWNIETGTCGWLASQMSPEDLGTFPVLFTEVMSWPAYFQACHDYAWRHIMRPSSKSEPRPRL